MTEADEFLQLPVLSSSNAAHNLKWEVCNNFMFINSPQTHGSMSKYSRKCLNSKNKLTKYAWKEKFFSSKKLTCDAQKHVRAIEYVNRVLHPPCPQAPA